MSNIKGAEAAKIYFLREKDGRVTFRVDPPVSLLGRASELPYYGDKGFWLKNEDELLNWLRSVADMKKK